MSLNDKQELFALNVAAGINQTEACVNAGYSRNGAAAAACRLMKNQAVLARIEELKKQQNRLNKNINKIVNNDVNTDVNPVKSGLPPNDDPLQFLVMVMNDDNWPHKLRIDAAKTLMPYKHGRIGETGKKEAARDVAIEKSRAGGLSARLEQKGLKQVK
ncbi:MAG: terminase small subunit [Snodgrassella sp.]|uniref:terminase small subunit n=1 Tax=Snodgrassella sp. TaxID=2815304 RepID=UPI0025905C14|nr:terminase small subunit [Snodgrassella sp.]MCO6506237.1 terminase small subunit [Snodgrassella sp.]MCO6508337.1 terminase small subunit [Snodgrassella sp.]MCO6517412.1 terminase small subunit [Snodgrassella sp.]